MNVEINNRESWITAAERPRFWDSLHDGRHDPP